MNPPNVKESFFIQRRMFVKRFVGAAMHWSFEGFFCKNFFGKACNGWRHGIPKILMFFARLHALYSESIQFVGANGLWL